MEFTYSECLTICTQIILGKGQYVPHKLCKACGKELQVAYDFYKKVEESKRVLKQYVEQLRKQKKTSGKQRSSVLFVNMSCLKGFIDMKTNQDLVA